jgi:hypothetical protein
MASNLPSSIGDVLQAVGEQGTPGIHRGGSVVRRLVQDLELGLQCFQIEKECNQDMEAVKGKRLCSKKLYCNSGVGISQHCTGIGSFSLSVQQCCLGSL